MVSQSPLEYDEIDISTLHFGGFLLPSESYKTVATIFPGTNCNRHWGHHGDFFIDFNMYEAGKKIACVSTKHVTEKGHIQVDFDDLADLFDKKLMSVVMSEFHHSKEIPVELYFSHIHRKTGAYVSYPSLGFMGDQLYPETHNTQLENTIFWPGIPQGKQSTAEVLLVNPTRFPLQYQITLYHSDRQLSTSEVYKLPAFTLREHCIVNEFAAYRDEIEKNGNKCSICVSARFKVIAYLVIKSRKSDVITTIDHFHSYCIY